MFNVEESHRFTFQLIDQRYKPGLMNQVLAWRAVERCVRFKLISIQMESTFVYKDAGNRSFWVECRLRGIGILTLKVEFMEAKSL